MNIAVIGLGSVGLTVVGAASRAGHDVHAYELNEVAIQKAQDMILSETYSNDAYLFITLRAHLENIHFSSIYDENLRACDVKLICVDTINVKSAVQMLAPFIRPQDVVIIESTVSDRDCILIRELLEMLTQMKVKEDFILAFVPERVMEGALLENFESMPRPIGTYDVASYQIVKKVYEGLGVMGELKYTDPRHASAAKDFENAFRFVEISIANEFADICRENNLDFDKIRKLVNVKGHEMGYNELLQSGIGIGGPCIPMAADIVAKMNWENSDILRTAIELNMGRPISIADAILAILHKQFGSLDDKRIAVFGATYRPDGSDSRDAPATEIITRLSHEITPIYISDPLYKNGGVVEKLYPNEIEEEFDAVVVLVGHGIFKDLSMMKCNFFIDVTGVVKKYPKGAKRKRLQV